MANHQPLLLFISALHIPAIISLAFHLHLCYSWLLSSKHPHPELLFARDTAGTIALVYQMKWSLGWCFQNCWPPTNAHCYFQRPIMKYISLSSLDGHPKSTLKSRISKLEEAMKILRSTLLLNQHAFCTHLHSCPVYTWTFLVETPQDLPSSLFHWLWFAC